MRYKLTCLTPVLVGDGYRLSPIDYMVWKDQVNVLDQRRIFRLLAKGPRLESYLVQLRKAEKLDFASWGGFAQNFADRRVPFEHPSAAAAWEKAQAESLRIPTFVSGPQGPYLPGTALKGALRTGMLYARWKDGGPRNLESFQGDRIPRQPGQGAEEQALGAQGFSVMRSIAAADSGTVPTAAMKVYMLRVSTLQTRGQGKFELGWKQTPRGTVSRPEEATPIFAEMAAAGTVFEGDWSENQSLQQPEIQRALRWRNFVNTARLFENANQYACALLNIQRQYAGWTGIPELQKSVEDLESHLERAQANAKSSCLICLGWGSGLLAKTGWLDTGSDSYRQTLQNIGLYSKAVQSGLPFPKTRKILFLGNKPAALPGWALLESAE